MRAKRRSTPDGVLSQLTLAAVSAEALRAHLKHGERSLLNPEMPDGLKLAALVEEIGEVAELLTYDKVRDDATELEMELLQVASVALSWVESLNA
jgi:hypothetical protein